MKNYSNIYFNRKNAIAAMAASTGIITMAQDYGYRISDPDKKKWEDLLAACDKPAYSVVFLDKIGDEINGKIVSGIKGAYNSIKETTGAVIDSAKSYQAKTAKINKIKAFYSIVTADKEELPKKEAASFGQFLGRGLMGFAVVTDLIIFGKNLYESYENGKRVLYSLPLQKFGIKDVAIPTPDSIKENGRKLKMLVEQHKDSPEDLAQLLEIAKTLKAYSSDFVSSVASALYLFLDVVDLVVSLGSAMVLKPLTGWANLLLALPIIGYEFANDSILESSFGGAVEAIKEICAKHLAEPEENPVYNQEPGKSRYITLEDLNRLSRTLKPVIN